MSLSFGKTHKITADFDVVDRIHKLRTWEKEWEARVNELNQFIGESDPEDPVALQIGEQVAELYPRYELIKVKEPLEFDRTYVEEAGYDIVARELRVQYASLSNIHRKIWLRNLEFVITPDLKKVIDKIKKVRSNNMIGQQRNILLSGESRMGKSTFVWWLYIWNLPSEEDNRNYVPMVITEIPENETHPIKSIMRDGVNQFGRVFSAKDTKPELKRKLMLYGRKCGMEIFAADEVHRLSTKKKKQGMVELSNKLLGTTILCTSARPNEFLEGDNEIKGRWDAKDHMVLEVFKGERLEGLLTMIEPLLPFPEPSHLALREVKDENSKVIPGPAAKIEEFTDGIMQKIMRVIIEASELAIDEGSPKLTVSHIERAWNSN